MTTRSVTSAIDFLNRGGRNAVTARAVADAAGVQALSEGERALLTEWLGRLAAAES